MAKQKKSSARYSKVSADAAGCEFRISVRELELLMQTRGHEGIRELNDSFGGLNGLEEKLKTNLITGKNRNKRSKL